MELINRKKKKGRTHLITEAFSSGTLTILSKM